ncbi:hypothetical protein Tco_1058108 [Tanacetum coccineum]|uniref:AP2/ERF domain-containing protein n=1 Tax=Tanacetum coccineum TaxID=301880 RepID=A0ABQ5H797_9ASTR
MVKLICSQIMFHKPYSFNLLAYDRAAIKFWGPDADINFDAKENEEDMKQVESLSKEEFIHILRRKGSGSSRRSSKYRREFRLGHRKKGRFYQYKNKILGFRSVYLGLYDNKVEAAREAATSFEPSTYGASYKNLVGRYEGTIEPSTYGMKHIWGNVKFWLFLII